MQYVYAIVKGIKQNDGNYDVPSIDKLTDADIVTKSDLNDPTHKLVVDNLNPGDYPKNYFALTYYDAINHKFAGQASSIDGFTVKAGAPTGFQMNASNGGFTLSK